MSTTPLNLEIVKAMFLLLVPFRYVFHFVLQHLSFPCLPGYIHHSRIQDYHLAITTRKQMILTIYPASIPELW